MKRTVHYVRDELTAICEGFGALVRPVDHSDTEHVSNTKHVLTSVVIRDNGDGSFETQNSIYIPVEVN